ncbi:mitochondrial 54S ribosomal protein YmL41 [Dimargaris xerosporica]|nr:mitochondrial 54S ribosomal protein YmL41 [Dimargaris xerosporica]
MPFPQQLFGQRKVFFPNIIFRLVRSERLQPNQAAFKVPVNVNKFDVRDYLTHLYGVTVLDVRTVIYPGSKKLNRASKETIKKPRVKKAIVTLAEEFKYPAPPNRDDFEGAFVDLSMKVQALKMRGWRIRSPLRKELTKLTKEKMDREEKEKEKS